ncbi:MAG: energy-coupling factor ABC transporter ATP-binding protein [Tenericutes bacterium]|nr:energy-coupling factor ABC transporter ATP-binding protein [Mycoplasmatota bacterium]
MEVIFRNVSYSYDGINNAVDNISVFLDSNLIHGIIGPIGSGKSTMLELMNGIMKPTSGKVLIGKYDLSNEDGSFDFNKFRYDVGLVYQFPEKQFFCNTVGEEVAFAEKIFKTKNASIRKKVIDILKIVGLDESYISRNPFSLNGGEKRRVAIASVLISNPKVLILDEPTIGLDDKSKKRLMKLLKNLKVRYNKTIVIVTHDVDMLYEIVDNIVVLDKGKIISEGNKVNVFSNVEYLNKHNTPIPNIVRFEKKIYDKYGLDMGYIPNMNALIRKIADISKGGGPNER